MVVILGKGCSVLRVQVGNTMRPGWRAPKYFVAGTISGLNPSAFF